MLRGLWAFFVFVVFTVVCGFLASVISLLRPRSNAVMSLGRVWGSAILGAMGVTVEYEGLDAARSRLPCIYVSNHQSNADIWALLRVLPTSTRFVAKHSLFRIPFLGWAMSASGFISIDRRDRRRAIRSLDLAAERIRNGTSVVLFPEGTRSRDGRLGDFKKGPFHLALAAGVPLVPLAITGSYAVLPPGSLSVRGDEIRVRFLPAVETTSYAPSDHRRLAATVRAAIEQALEAEESRPPGDPPGGGAP